MSGIPRTATEAGAALRSGEATSVELTRALLARADELDGALGVYLARFDEAALAAAARADAELASGRDRGPLHGIPVGIKDIIATRESKTTGQSVVHDPAWWEGRDAPVVERLRAAGAVITGKTTTCEYACGLPDAEKPFPIPRNAWDPETWPGGSSSGSGSGVSAGLFYGALGTDTGGSIRLPASYCGISGLKPTYGIVPKNGCYTLGSSFDHIGPMARSASDCAALLDVLVGPDPGDPTVTVRAPGGYLAGLDGSLAGVTVGVERASHFSYPGADPALEPLFEAAAAVLAEAGATLVEVEIPYFQELQDAAMLGFPVEALAYHLRFLRRRWGDYGRPARAVIAAGALVGAADYVQAQKVRRQGQQLVGELFGSVDLIVSPTTATGAPPVEGLAFDDLIASVFTPVWNALGNPALSVPMGFGGGGLPLGLQIAGRPLEDGLVLRAGDAYQARTAWHLAEPRALAAA